MCRLCDDDDPDDPTDLDHCCCIKCGADVCYEANEFNGLRMPAPDWDESLICELCFLSERDDESLTLS
jgi:hypothetical protein